MSQKHTIEKSSYNYDGKNTKKSWKTKRKTSQENKRETYKTTNNNIKQIQ